MISKIEKYKEIDSCFRRNDNRLNILSSRKIDLLFFILILFLITSFLASASSQNISMTNIWYKKLPNYTHLTIKASGAILEYEVFYLEDPGRVAIDIKNAF